MNKVNFEEVIKKLNGVFISEFMSDEYCLGFLFHSDWYREWITFGNDIVLYNSEEDEYQDGEFDEAEYFANYSHGYKGKQRPEDYIFELVSKRYKELVKKMQIYIDEEHTPIPDRFKCHKDLS